MVVANFLLSAEVQAMRQNPVVWGDQSVIDLARLTPEDKALFFSLSKIATMTIMPPLPAPVQDLGKSLPEPHPSWTEALRQWWVNRRRNTLRLPLSEVDVYDDDFIWNSR